MTQIKKGLIMPDTNDLLIYYLILSKEEGTYVSNRDIAQAILYALKPEDANDVARRILSQLV